MTAKKTPPKKQEQPAEQQQTPAEEEPVQQDEPVRPMAVQPPTPEEQIEALTIRLKVAEEWITRHNRYHFGGMLQG